MSESTRYKFQFSPGQEPELVPAEKAALFARFEGAFTAWIHTLDEPAHTCDAFLAGYRAGYEHAKDDAQEAREKR